MRQRATSEVMVGLPGFLYSPIYANERYTLRYRGIGVCTTVGCLLFERRAGFEFKIWDFTPAQGSARAFFDARDGFGRAGESRSGFGEVSPGIPCRGLG